MLPLDDIDAHAPEGGEGKNGNIKFRNLLPVQVEEISHNNGKDYHCSKDANCDHTDVKIDIKESFSNFLKSIYDNTRSSLIVREKTPARENPYGSLAF